MADFFLEKYADLGITTSEAMFIIQLMKHKWDRNAPYPGLVGIAKRMGMTPTAARSHGRSLERKGYLVRQMRVGQTNLFNLQPLFRALEIQLDLAESEAANRAKRRDN